MSIEIQKPELERRVRARIRSGQFQNVDEVLEKALDALEEKAQDSSADQQPRTEGRKSLVELFEESPLRGLDLDFSRNRSTGRPIDLP
jgi:Arc/MetJ-type ribon-helix-helix transcriptional regulator